MLVWFALVARAGLCVRCVAVSFFLSWSCAPTILSALFPAFAAPARASTTLLGSGNGYLFFSRGRLLCPSVATLSLGVRGLWGVPCAFGIRRLGGVLRVRARRVVLLAVVGLCYPLAFAMRSPVGGLFPGPFGSSGLTDGVSASAASLWLLVPVTGFRLAIGAECAARAKRFCALEGAWLFTGGLLCWGSLLGISRVRRSFRRPVRGCRAVPRILVIIRCVHCVGIPVPLICL